MKPLPLVLAASLVANAALVTVTLRHSSAYKDDGIPTPSDASAKPAPPQTKAGFTLPPELVAALNANDVGALRDLLRAAGLSDDIVRSIVQMQIGKKYEERFKVLHRQAWDPDGPWWKNDRERQSGFLNGMTKAEREESRRLQREMRDEIESILGPGAARNRWQDPRLSFLPDEKRQALQQIQQDYQELINEVNLDAQGFRLPSDAEKIRFLQEEQKRDLEALMSPEERQAYELRMSPSAQQLRGKMTWVDATEAEYLALFPLQKAFDEKFNNDANHDPFVERDQTYWKERHEAEKEIMEQIKSVVGEERYAESLRLQDNDWRQLEAATRRLELPADTPARLYSLRDTAASAVQQITDNPALGTAQKKEALAALAADTREQVRASLGDEGAEAYFKNNGMGWLKELDRGNTITFRTDSPGWNTKALPNDPNTSVAK